MAKVSLSITSQSTSGKDQSKTIGYINPTATNEHLRQTSILFNALSQNTYDGAIKTVKTNVNDPDPEP